MLTTKLDFSNGQKSRAPLGFTLVELLVAITVVTLLMSILVQMFGQASNGVGHINRTLDSASQCRAALDRIGYDINAVVAPLPSNRITLTNSSGNDQLQLYSAVRTGTPSSRFALLTYTIGTTQSSSSAQTIPALVRENAAVGWTTDPLSAPVGASDCVGAGIFRFEVSFLSKDGTITAKVPTDQTKLRAIIVAVATLDSQTYKTLSVTQITSLPSLFGAAVDGTTPSAGWENIDYSAFPPSVKQNVRIYQKYFYVR